jgi:hypothetical protein
MYDYVVVTQPNKHIVLGVNDNRPKPETETIIQITETHRDNDYSLRSIIGVIIGTVMFMVIGIMYILLLT